MPGIRGCNGGLLRRLHKLGFECIALPGSGEVLTGAGPYRIASSLDYARRKYTFAQAVAGNQPLFVPGDPCAWRFGVARSDRLLSAVVSLGANPYTVVLVDKLASVPGGAVYYCPWANGVLALNGQGLLYDSGGGGRLQLYHWGPGISTVLHSAPALALHSYLVRWDGANVLTRVDGADNAPAALAACAPATTSQVIGAYDAAGTDPLDGDIGLVAVATRSLSAGDMTELSAILDAGWADKTEHVLDANMELAGIANWPAIDGNCATAKVGSPHSGTQCLRVTVNVAVGYAAAIQGFAFEQGRRVRLRGWARGDGGAGVPVLYLSGAALLWTGTNSNAWQSIDITFAAPYANNRLDLGTTSASGYVEFDDLQSEQVLG